MFQEGFPASNGSCIFSKYQSSSCLPVPCQTGAANPYSVSRAGGCWGRLLSLANCHPAACQTCGYCWRWVAAALSMEELQLPAKAVLCMYVEGRQTQGGGWWSHPLQMAQRTLK